MLLTILLVFHIIICVALIITVLLQQSEGGALGMGGGPSGFMTAGVNKALDFINANLTEDFSEDDLAATAGMTAPAFSRSFRKHTGMGVVEYVNRLRINLACQMLMNERGQSVTDICFAVGFNNLSNFNRHFLNLKGMSPSQFRATFAANKAFVTAE